MQTKISSVQTFLHHMQTHKSQQFRNVLQNPLVTLPILIFLLRATHSWFNELQSGEVTFWGQKKFTQVYTIYTGLPPDDGYTVYIHSIGNPWYIHGYTMFIPCILVRTAYTWNIRIIYQVYTENQGSRC